MNVKSEPLRTKHCKSCGRCVATFDHHCDWIGNCIGEWNKKYFYVYIWMQLGMLIWVVAMVIW